MNQSFEIAKQEIAELAEQFCGGYVRDHKHGLEKIRALLVSNNLAHSQSIKSTFSQHRFSMRSNKKKDTFINSNTEELLSEVKKCRQIILTQQERISIIPQLESELKESQKRLSIEISKITNKYQAEISQCHKEMNQHSKLIAKNLQLEEKLKLLTMEIESFRRQFHKEIDVDGRVSQLQELSVSRNKEIQKLQITSNRLKVQLDLKTQEVSKLNTKVSELEKKIEDLNKALKPVEKDKLDENETNACMVSYYKKKLEEKEAEVKRLNTRVCKMQRTEVQCKIKEEGFENERKEYLDRIAELCQNSKNLERTMKEKLSGTGFVKEESKRTVLFTSANYENLTELAKSASEAYSTVMSKEKFTNRSTRPTTAVDSRTARGRSYNKLI